MPLVSVISVAAVTVVSNVWIAVVPLCCGCPYSFFSGASYRAGLVPFGHKSLTINTYKHRAVT